MTEVCQVENSGNCHHYFLLQHHMERLRENRNTLYVMPRVSEFKGPDFFYLGVIENKCQGLILEKNLMSVVLDFNCNCHGPKASPVKPHQMLQ